MGISINLPVNGIPSVATAADLPVVGLAGQAYIAIDTGALYGWSVTNMAWETGGIGGGTVSSVALTAPNIFTVSGSPVTTTGTLALALATQSANTVWAGPASGAASAPAFRSIVTADLPTISPTKGGTGVANNAASTITITGAHSLGLTVSANTSLTLPTAGTLATLAGTETLTNKTLTSPIITTASQAKGDILINNGTNYVRLPVGADTNVLTVDSGQTLGVKWAAAAGGGVAWGSITGTLSAQTDLQAALDAKLDLVGGTVTGPITFAGASYQLNRIGGSSGFSAIKFDLAGGGVNFHTNGDVNNPVLAISNALYLKGSYLFVQDNTFTIAASNNAPTDVYSYAFRLKAGSNLNMGTAVLSGGTVTVSNNRVTSTCNIFLTSQVDGGTPGWVRVSARTNSTSFTITSSSASDTSTIGWMIMEPA